MTREVPYGREQSYSEGWHQGRVWAEYDLQNHVDLSEHLVSDAREANEHRRGTTAPGYLAAWCLGVARGYRDTFARYEAGEVTWETFDTAPVNR